jgi:hypothetical protein
LENYLDNLINYKSTLSGYRTPWSLSANCGLELLNEKLLYLPWENIRSEKQSKNERFGIVLKSGKKNPEDKNPEEKIRKTKIRKKKKSGRKKSGKFCNKSQQFI